MAEDDRLTIDVTRLSYSQLSTFLGCGEEYRLQKIEHAPKTPAAWFAQGTAFHAGFEAWERSDRQLPIADACEIGVAAFDGEIEAMKEWDDDIENWMCGPRSKPKVDLKNRRLKVPEQISAYCVYALSQPWHIWRTADGELGLELQISLSFDQCDVVGAVDQIIEWPDGTLEIVDGKTGAKRPDSYTQLGIYALGVRMNHGGDVELGHYYMAKDASVTKPVDLSGYDYAKLNRWFSDFARARAIGAFIPQPTEDNCRPCGVKKFCSAIDGELAGLYHPDLVVRAQALEAYHAELGWTPAG